MKEDILKVINNYGVIPQLKYFQSEVFELNEAIIQKEYSVIGGKPEPLINTENNHIAEELSDVMFMLKQFQYYYGINDSNIKEIMKFKIERQLKRIEESKIAEVGK